MRRSLVTFLGQMFGINGFINGPVCYADKISISSDINSCFFLFCKRFIVSIIKDWSLNTFLWFGGGGGGGIRPNRPLLNLYSTLHISINIASSCESRTGFSLRETDRDTRGLYVMWCFGRAQETKFNLTPLRTVTITASHPAHSSLALPALVLSLRLESVLVERSFCFQ